MRQIIQEENAVAQSWPMPAPVGGWNARDALANMKPIDAIQLDNWFPGTTACDSRMGSGTVATLPGGQVIRTLMGLAKFDGTYKRFAVSQNGVYDITGGGVVGPPVVAVTNAEWEYTQIHVGGVSYLWMCCGDGANNVLLYNSTAATWTPLDGASVPALTGPVSNKVSNVSLWKYRLILCERDTLKFWYGPLNSVGGVFNAFDLGQVFRKGGHLVATSSWSIDGGSGSDDHFVAISSEGEVAVYRGTDPSISANFDLVGVYDIGKPASKRCFTKLGGDLAVMTEQGIVPLSKGLLSASVDSRVALTDKIQAAFNSYFKTFGPQFGWSAVLLPKGPAMIVNVPTGAQTSYQFVMNTLTGAWCRFKGWDAEAMLVLDGRFFFAAGNLVKEGWVGTTDDGAAITAVAAHAYSYGPSKMRGKRITMVRPTMHSTAAALAISVLLNSDFAAALNMSPSLSIASGGSLWDSAVFDTSVWGGVITTTSRWRSVKHSASRAFSLQVGVQTKGVAVSWSATDFIGEVTQVGLT